MHLPVFPLFSARKKILACNRRSTIYISTSLLKSHIQCVCLWFLRKHYIHAYIKTRQLYITLHLASSCGGLSEMKAFSFLTLVFVATTPIAATQKVLCKPPMQIRVDKHNVTVSSAGELTLESGVSYPNGTYWEESDMFVLCPCKVGRCIAKCSSEFIFP